MSGQGSPSDLTTEKGALRVPYPVLVVVFFTLISTVATGSWYMAALSSRVDNTNLRFEEFKKEDETRRNLSAQDHRLEAALVSSIDNRLNRIEAQLTNLTIIQNNDRDAARRGNSNNQPGTQDR